MAEGANDFHANNPLWAILIGFSLALAAFIGLLYTGVSLKVASVVGIIIGLVGWLLSFHVVVYVAIALAIVAALGALYALSWFLAT